MRKAGIALIIVGMSVILFAAFCPLAEIHGATWRMTIGSLGCFSLASGVYRLARNR